MYPFLGSYLLGEAIDRAGADLVLHGHAHSGVEKELRRGYTRPQCGQASHPAPLQRLCARPGRGHGPEGPVPFHNP